MNTPGKKLAFGHVSHREFNKRFEVQTPANDIVNAPWLSNEAVTGLPSVRRDFNLNRDPMIAEQIRDLEKSEARRREDQNGSNSPKKHKDQPKLELKPPRDTGPRWNAPPALGTNQEEAWLSAERDFVMANVPDSKPTVVPANERNLFNSEPARLR